MISLVACATAHVCARVCLHMHSSTGHHAYHKQGKNLIAISLWDFCLVYAEHGGLCYCVCASSSLWDFCLVYDKCCGVCYYCVRVNHHCYKIFALFTIKLVTCAIVYEWAHTHMCVCVCVCACVPSSPWDCCPKYDKHMVACVRTPLCNHASLFWLAV